jgi:hypothetical protein
MVDAPCSRVGHIYRYQSTYVYFLYNCTGRHFTNFSAVNMLTFFLSISYRTNNAYRYLRKAYRYSTIFDLICRLIDSFKSTGTKVNCTGTFTSLFSYKRSFIPVLVESGNPTNFIKGTVRYC